MCDWVQRQCGRPSLLVQPAITQGRSPSSDGSAYLRTLSCGSGEPRSLQTRSLAVQDVSRGIMSSVPVRSERFELRKSLTHVLMPVVESEVLAFVASAAAAGSHAVYSLRHSRAGQGLHVRMRLRHSATPGLFHLPLPLTSLPLPITPSPLANSALCSIQDTLRTTDSRHITSPLRPAQASKLVRLYRPA